MNEHDKEDKTMTSPTPSNNQSHRFLHSLYLRHRLLYHWRVAQLVAQGSLKPKAAGSRPASPTKLYHAIIGEWCNW